jgi:hypothetical protein
MAPVRLVLHRLSCSNETVQNAPKHEFWVQWSGSGAFVVKNSNATLCSELVRYGHEFGLFYIDFRVVTKWFKTPQNMSFGANGVDEDIATNDTSTPTPVSTSTTPLGPITRARARRLTHQVSSLLSSGSSYLENGDTCTLVLLRNNGLDQKGRGIAQAGFGLQNRHDL